VSATALQHFQEDSAQAGAIVAHADPVPRTNAAEQLLVLSHNVPMITAASNWLALFYHRDLPASHSLATDYWPLATVLLLHASSPTTPDQRGRVVRGPSSAGYCHPPTAELPKTERAPISTSGPSIFSMSPKFSMLPNQAISSYKSIRFSPLAAARRSIILSWPEALNARGSRRAGRMAIGWSACSLAVA
jgi:hypothetical protein